MKLPNGERAFVDLAKLRDYCLNPQHPRGRHKARVFAASLGLAAHNAALLQQALLAAARDGETQIGEIDRFGRRFVIDFEMKGPKGRAFVRSTWIIRVDDDIPRLTTYYVL